MGAWIETQDNATFALSVAKSHPTWVRGLKHIYFCPRTSYEQSHPTWVRGLKPLTLSPYDLNKKVAPYVGAWIETIRPMSITGEPMRRTLRGCVD